MYKIDLDKVITTIENLEIHLLSDEELKLARNALIKGSLFQRYVEAEIEERETGIWDNV